MKKSCLSYTLPIRVSVYNEYEQTDLSVEIIPTFNSCPGVNAIFRNLGDELQSTIDSVFDDITAHGFSYTASDNTIDFPNGKGNALNVKIKVLIYGKRERVMAYINKLSDKSDGVYKFNKKEGVDDKDKIS